MFATSGVSTILGLAPEQLTGKSFYYCITENCLRDAVTCLESAKANDSIAYLRFWYRDPTKSSSRAPSESMPDVSDSDEEDEGGVRLGSVSRSSVEMQDAVQPSTEVNQPPPNSTDIFPTLNGHVEADDSQPNGTHSANGSLGLPSEDRTRSSSGNSTDLDGNANDAIFDPPMLQRSNSSYTPVDEDPMIEVEAVISCTSDGLVVVLRRARPLAPSALGEMEPTSFENGLFASPWATNPIMPPKLQQTTKAPQMSFPAMQEPVEAGFMAAIRDVAVFAWSLTGINGSLSEYGRGKPSGEALPPGGLPIWDPNAPRIPANEAQNGFSGSAHRPLEHMGDPSSDEITSSDDEILWKRSSTMSAWRRPKRRGHGDAFGEEGIDGIDGGSSDGTRKRTSRSLTSKASY